MHSTRRNISSIHWLKCAFLCTGLLLCRLAGPEAMLLPRLRAEDKPAAAAEELADFEESWQVIYVGNSRVGYQWSSSGRKERDGQDIVVTGTEMILDMSRFGQPVKMKITINTEETPDGELLKFDYELLNPPAAPTRTVGRVENEKLLLDKETNGKSRPKEIAWDKSLKAPNYQDRMLRDNPLKPGEKRTIKAFNPAFDNVGTITLQAGTIKDTPLLGGTSKKLLEVNVTDSLAPLITVQEYLDEKGETLRTNTALMKMSTYKVTKAEALKGLSGAEVDLAVMTLVKTGAIERSQQTRRVVYRIATPGDDPEQILAAGPTQEITRVDPHSVDLAVSAIVPPEEATEGPQGAPGKEFLSSNSYLQSDDKLVKKHAKDAAGDEADPWKAAQLMEHWVFANIKKKNFSTLLASAAEVAKELSGDCTEHAVLLAAMARARGIPSRVVVGLVYVPRLSSFGGHMWTEVYVRGGWIPLDATLGKGGIAADHIKFADSSFSDEGDAAPIASFLPMATALGKLKIDVRDVKYKE